MEDEIFCSFSHWFIDRLPATLLSIDKAELCFVGHSFQLFKHK